MAAIQEVKDMMGSIIPLPAQPRRIVSLVPSQTELLYHLGLEEEVVGITKFCVHPESWFRSKSRVGGTKTVDLDKVDALRPDLIIANKEENVEEQIAALRSIAPVWVSDITSFAEALQMITQIGVIAGRQEKSMALAMEIDAGFQQLMAGTPRRVAYAIWKDPWMWAGGDTFINDLLQHLGWHNVLGTELRYPECELKKIALLKPEFILLSSEPYPFKEKHMDLINGLLPQALVLMVDGEMFSWYGSRLLQAIPYFQKLISEHS